MRREYSVVAELKMCMDGTNELDISYYEDGVNIGEVEPMKDYTPNKMDLILDGVNTIVLGFKYVCKSDEEIGKDLLKLRVKNRLCQNLIATQKNGLIVLLADKLKQMAISEGYDVFMAHGLSLKFKELNDGDTLNVLLKDIDRM